MIKRKAKLKTRLVTRVHRSTNISASKTKKRGEAKKGRGEGKKKSAKKVEGKLV